MGKQTKTQQKAKGNAMHKTVDNSRYWPRLNGQVERLSWLAPFAIATRTKPNSPATQLYFITLLILLLHIDNKAALTNR